VVPSPSPSPGDEALGGVVAISANDVWAVGSDAYGPLTEQWNGSQWRVVPSPNPPGGGGLSAVTVVPGTRQLWAAGDYATARSGAYAMLSEHWNGTDWTIVPSPNEGAVINYLYGVAAVAAADVWMVGIAYNTTPGPSQTLIEQWDGRQWQVVAGPNPGSTTNALQGVATIPGTNALWAVGEYGNSRLNPTKTLTELYC
jgi:hypothetical protein